MSSLSLSHTHSTESSSLILTSSFFVYFDEMNNDFSLVYKVVVQCWVPQLTNCLKRIWPKWAALVLLMMRWAASFLLLFALSLRYLLLVQKKERRCDRIKLVRGDTLKNIVLPHSKQQRRKKERKEKKRKKEKKEMGKSQHYWWTGGRGWWLVLSTTNNSTQTHRHLFKAKFFHFGDEIIIILRGQQLVATITIITIKQILFYFSQVLHMCIWYSQF